MGVRLADRSDHGDFGVCGDRVLDHRRIDIVAATDNQIFRAAAQRERSVRVKAAQVARVEPSALDPDAPVVGFPEVAGKHIGAAYADHAGCAGFGKLGGPAVRA
jgi:hypothetical protein